MFEDSTDQEMVPSPGTAIAATAAIAAGEPILVRDRGADACYVAWAAAGTGPIHLAICHEAGRGMLRAAMTAEHADWLALSSLHRGDPLPPSVTIGSAERLDFIQAAIGTLRRLALAEPGEDEFISPGHVHPLIVAGCTDDRPACLADLLVDLVDRSANAGSVAGFIEVDPQAIAASGALAIREVTFRDLALHLYRDLDLVSPVVETTIPGDLGDFLARGFKARREDRDFVAFQVGTDRGWGAPLRVHVHRRCALGDVFGGVACECGERLQGAIREIQAAGAGAIIYFGEPLSGPCTATEPEELDAPATWLVAGEVASVLRQLEVGRIAYSSNGTVDTRLLRQLGIEVASEPDVEPTEARLSRAVAGIRTI